MKNKLGFTLLELLVVVLIIGILAAIAIPQYKMVIARSKFTPLKSMTKSIVETIQSYYLVNNAYPTRTKNLDIRFGGIKETYYDTGWFKFKVSGDIECAVGFNSSKAVNCYRTIAGKQITYQVNIDNNKPVYCFAYSKDLTHVTNRLCKQETNKNGDCGYTSYCLYKY